jgi:peptidyl-prolyl cis-trans isomerase SurA
MKKAILCVLLSMMLLCIQAEQLDEIVAKVGRDIILKSELMTQLQQMKAAGVPENEINPVTVLNSMIESRLIVQTARNEGFEVDTARMKEAADNQIKDIASQFATQAEFQAELKKAGLTVLELKDYYIDMMTEQSLRTQIIEQYIKSKIHVTEAEIEDYYQEHKAEIPMRPALEKIGMIRHIITPGKDTRSEALIAINKIKDQLNEGRDFNEVLAQAKAADPTITGGNIGFIGHGTMNQKFEDVAFTLLPGEISDVVEVDYGYHIIKVEEKKDEEINVSHILKMVTLTQTDIAASRQQMQGVLQKLRDGADFAEMAKTYSDDDSTAVKGGVVGEFIAGTYPPLFADDVKDLPLGAYTDVINKDNVLYIFGKLETVPERLYEYSEIYDQLRDLVLSAKEQESYEKWISELIKNSYVEVLLEQ